MLKRLLNWGLRQFGRILCDRCLRAVEGSVSQDDSEFAMSAGVYVAAGWPAMANPGEEIICDACMWRDPRYIAVYGDSARHSL